MTLVGKILTVAILLMSVLFMGFAVMNYATARNYRAIVKGEGSTAGLESQVAEVTRKVEQREQELQRARYRIDLETAARRSALVVLERKALTVTAQLEQVQNQYNQLARQQREQNENVKAVQDEVARLLDEVENVRGALTAAIVERNDDFAEVTELVDTLNQGEGPLRRLHERSRQLTEARGR